MCAVAWLRCERRPRDVSVARGPWPADSPTECIDLRLSHLTWLAGQSPAFPHNYCSHNPTFFPFLLLNQHQSIPQARHNLSLSDITCAYWSSWIHLSRFSWTYQIYVNTSVTRLLQNTLPSSRYSIDVQHYFMFKTSNIFTRIAVCLVTAVFKTDALRRFVFVVLVIFSRGDNPREKTRNVRNGGTTLPDKCIKFELLV